jgi:hypothetical protein
MNRIQLGLNNSNVVDFKSLHIPKMLLFLSILFHQFNYTAAAEVKSINYILICIYNNIIFIIIIDSQIICIMTETETPLKITILIFARLCKTSFVENLANHYVLFSL